MIDTHFAERDLWFLATGMLLLLSSVVFFAYGNKRLGLWTLVLGGFTLRLLMAVIDPFVNIWDEQYHALVAKNLTKNFIMPVLVENPVLPLDPTYWAFTHIWLNKPPLFLWQMALSLKFFGTHAWAIRIPSVILSTLMIPAVYRSAKLLINERAAFIAALLIAASNILINVVSGFLNTDQNDTVFVAYLCFSFWAWIEYMHSPRKTWILLTGFFAACAVLTKWLPGMMVFGAWGIALLCDKEKRTQVKYWLHIASAGIITVLLAAPWFVYVSTRWPEQWAGVMRLYSDHITHNLDHSGSWWYHFAELVEQNGLTLVIVFVVSSVFFLRDGFRQPARIGVVAVILIVYAFYSMVATRMPLFCLGVLPLILIVVAYGTDAVMNFIPEKRTKLILAVTGVLIVATSVNIGRLEHFHTLRNTTDVYRPARLNNRLEFMRTLRDIPADAVVFNCGDWNAVACMFYVDCTAYDQLPNEHQLFEAKNNNRPVYIFNDGHLPEELLLNPDVIIVEANLIRNGY